MSRIRTIKPEIWTSEQFVECSPIARLMFIGLWNFADDNGIHPEKPMRIKMQIFPGDSFKAEEINAMLAELAEVGLIERYVVDGTKYLSITGFCKHQRIDQPTFRYPLPNGQIPKNTPRRRGRVKQNQQLSKNVQRTPNEQAANAQQPRQRESAPSEVDPVDNRQSATDQEVTTQQNQQLSKNVQRTPNEQPANAHTPDGVRSPPEWNVMEWSNNNNNTDEPVDNFHNEKNTPSKSHGPEEKFAMVANWMPSKNFATYLLRAGINPNEDTANQLNNFRLYWLGRPQVRFDQQGWEFQFIKILKGGQGREKPESANNSSKSEGRAAVNAALESDDTSWAYTHLAP